MKAGTAGSVVDIKYRSSQVGWIGYGEQSSWLYEKLADLVMVANNRMWNCDIQSLSESIQYGTYPAQKNGHYDFHLDVGKAASARKLSTSLLISEPEVDYAGGQFEFLVGKVPKQVDLAAGSLVVFPSYLLHRVKPVTIGTRESLVTWVHGPAWK